MNDMNSKTSNAPNPWIWLYPFLSHLRVTSFEANLSGGGDSGSIDDMTWFRGEQIIPNAEVEETLEALKIDDGSPQRTSFLDALHIIVENDAANEGNYYDNEGGSVWARYLLDPQSGTVQMEEASYAENEPYDDDDDYEPEDDLDEDLDDDIGP